MKAAALPVFTVGVGEDRLARDIQLDRVSTPRRALKGTSLLIDAVIRQTGYAGETVTLDVEDGGRIVGSQAVKLPADGEPAPVRVRVMATDAGAGVLKFRISAARRRSDRARTTCANRWSRCVDRRERILHYEGEPRFEMKFLRQAVKRGQEPRGGDPAADGREQVHARRRRRSRAPARRLPATRAKELFAYRGLILSNVEASAFTGDQLRMIAEFVEKRGGGLLMLGGPRAFAEGGYAGTPVADALPVVLDRAVRGLERRRPAGRACSSVRPAPARIHAADADRPAPRLRRPRAGPTCRRSPASTRSAAIKPGATVLLNGTRRAPP